MQQDKRTTEAQGHETVQDGVVAKIAGIAAQEVEGIRMGGGGSQAAGSIMNSLTGDSGEGQTRGVAVEVGEEEAAVDLTMTTEYGKSIPQLSEAVRRNIVNRVENLIGLSVTEVNITVSNIFFPQEDQELRHEEVPICSATDSANADGSAGGAVQLIDELLASDSDYDRETWPQVRDALDHERSSYRKLFAY